ncbi:hypothetical protein N185_34075 [Sinorhizobium sp. GW3]|nr:hypothetical protein N185_34075 [Sinorhizobium sp. GW3]
MNIACFISVASTSAKVAQLFAVINEILNGKEALLFLYSMLAAARCEC